MSESDDAYWKRIAREHPYWAVITDDAFRGHILGAEAKQEFMATGVEDIGFALAMIRLHVDPGFLPRNALDFGCGVGRLAIPMARAAGRATGVDLSEDMLMRASECAAEQGISNLSLSAVLPDEKFDWINSYIVFQHIEPRKGIAILDDLLAHLVPAGAVSLQFSIYRDGRVGETAVKYSLAGRFDGRNYASFENTAHGEMPIYEYDLGDILYRFVKHGIETVTLHHTDHGGLHGVWIFGAKGKTAA